jgi:hypothetical protein
MQFSYTVACEFSDDRTAEEWIAWLRDEHLRDVCSAGALDAEVVRFDGLPVRCEVRYHFASRAAFERYEQAHAPRLRELGLARFPAERGLRYTRFTGEVAAAREPRPDRK